MIDTVILDNLVFGILVTFLNLEGEEICGFVVFSNGDRYVWKKENGIYYVLVDGEWIPIPTEEIDWSPGDPLPWCN